MNGRIILITSLIIAAICLPALLFAGEIEKDTASTDSTANICTEIMELMVNSNLKYNLDIVDDSLLPADSIRGIPNAETHYRKTDSAGNIYLWIYEKPDSLMAALARYEALFEKREYEAAVMECRDIIAEFPEYIYALTLLGDTYFGMNQFDSAMSYFRKAIDSNYADYDAHWFLADALWKTGKREEALKEISIAHILNCRNINLKMVLNQYREQTMDPWKEWSFMPRYAYTKSSDGVYIKTTQYWSIYAAIKAVWFYEPGYAESRTGEILSDSDISFQPEREAVLCWLAAQNENDIIANKVLRILNDDNFESFYMYEIMLKRIPGAAALLPTAIISALGAYLEKYH